MRPGGTRRSYAGSAWAYGAEDLGTWTTASLVCHARRDERRRPHRIDHPGLGDAARVAASARKRGAASTSQHLEPRLRNRRRERVPPTGADHLGRDCGRGREAKQTNREDHDGDHELDETETVARFHDRHPPRRAFPYREMQSGEETPPYCARTSTCPVSPEANPRVSKRISLCPELSVAPKSAVRFSGGRTSCSTPPIVPRARMLEPDRTTRVAMRRRDAMSLVRVTCATTA